MTSNTTSGTPSQHLWSLVLPTSRCATIKERATMIVLMIGMLDNAFVFSTINHLLL